MSCVIQTSIDDLNCSVEKINKQLTLLNRISYNSNLLKFMKNSTGFSQEFSKEILEELHQIKCKIESYL